MLKVLSFYMPDVFPYQSHWKMEECHNSIKSNWTLEQLNWKLYPAGDMAEYDGLTKLFVKLTENNLELFEDAYIKRWYKLSTDLKID